MGPATGSAVLVAFTPDVPFMSDQALHAVQKCVLHLFPMS